MLTATTNGCCDGRPDRSLHRRGSTIALVLIAFCQFKRAKEGAVTAYAVPALVIKLQWLRLSYRLKLFNLIIIEFGGPFPPLLDSTGFAVNVIHLTDVQTARIPEIDLWLSSYDYISRMIGNEASCPKWSVGGPYHSHKFLFLPMGAYGRTDESITSSADHDRPLSRRLDVRQSSLSAPTGRSHSSTSSDTSTIPSSPTLIDQGATGNWYVWEGGSLIRMSLGFSVPPSVVGRF